MKAQLKSWAFLRLRYLSDFVLSRLIGSRCMRLQAACEGINNLLHFAWVFHSSFTDLNRCMSTIYAKWHGGEAMKYAIGLALLVLSVAAQACGCGGAGLAEETYRWSREVRLEMLWWGVGVTLAVFGSYLILSLVGFSKRLFIAYCTVLALLNVVLSVWLFDSGRDALLGVYRAEHAMLMQIGLALLPVLHAGYQMVRFVQKQTQKRPVNPPTA